VVWPWLSWRKDQEEHELLLLQISQEVPLSFQGEEWQEVQVPLSLGLSITKIPFLHAQALGGRLSQCLGAWDTVGVSGWVRKVVSGGYRIPFKTLPRQSRVPVNPPTEGVAFNILYV
jgi:hypothetical protein